MSLYDWLQEFVDVNLPIGDFAKDAKADKTFPKNVSDWKALEQYIKTVNPQNPELEIIRNVFNYYLAEKNR